MINIDLEDFTGGQAFPRPGVHGMTLLQWYAGKALPECLEQVLESGDLKRLGPAEMSDVAEKACALAYVVAERMVSMVAEKEAEHAERMQRMQQRARGTSKG